MCLEHLSTSFLTRIINNQKFRQNTLNRVKGSGDIDVGVDRDFMPAVHDPAAGTGQTASAYGNRAETGARATNNMDTTAGIQYCYGSEAVKLTINLEKHPSHGLG